MDNKKVVDTSIEEIIKYYKNNKNMKITEENIFIVWNCKTLQNNKALVSTTEHDGMYYECTYNGDKKELYIDCYKKQENICIDLGGQ